MILSFVYIRSRINETGREGVLEPPPPHEQAAPMRPWLLAFSVTLLQPRHLRDSLSSSLPSFITFSFSSANFLRTSSIHSLVHSFISLSFAPPLGVYRYEPLGNVKGHSQSSHMLPLLPAAFVQMMLYILRDGEVCAAYIYTGGMVIDSQPELT